MPEERIDPAWAWTRYRPSDKAPWDLKRVGHLYRRAGFGATAAQLDEGVRQGVDATVASFFAARPDAELDSVWTALRENISGANSGEQLPAAWLYRMFFSPQPLVEKMTLCWHNHFATSNQKVMNARFMLGQYETMRRHALGNFRDMLTDISRDPAMMIWLDTNLSQRAMPNENYARELMELFSLGISDPRDTSRRNYTEQDIRQAARAFTGWRVESDGSIFRREMHDDGEKTVFARTGRWGWEDIVRLCLEHEACPYFITRKLFRFFVSDTLTPTADLLEPLARQLREGGFQIQPVVERILRSNLFFSSHAYRSKVKSPVEFALGVIRGLEGHMPHEGASRRFGSTGLAQVLESLGQRLFYPPSVAGWDGGAAWLNAQTLLLRHNLALALTSTQDDRFGSRTDPAALARRHDRRSDEDRADFFLKVFVQNDVTAETRTRLLDYLRRAGTHRYPVYWSAADAENQRVRSLCHLVLCVPEFQLS